MNVGLKPYPAMKDSGLPWLGEVPEHWDVLPLCAVATPKSTTNHQHRELLSVYLYQGVIRFSEMQEKRTNVTSEDLTKYQAVDPGDFVLNNQQAWRGSVGVSSLSGIVSPAYLVLALNGRLHTDFSNLLFRNRVMIDQYLICSRGVGSIQRNLYWPYLRRVVFPSPSLPEQSAIVHFLDHADRRIQRYIRAKQKLITLLKEQKQAIIHQAVTGQIDVRTGQPYPAYKPSAVRWLGNIPEHWEVWQIGHLGRVGNGSTPSRSNMGYWDGGTYPWLNSSSVNHSPIMQADQFVTDLALRECHLPQIQPGSVLVAITGQGKTRGTSAVLDTEATINQHVACVTTRNDVIGAEYLHLALLAAYRELRAISDDSGSTKGALTCWDISHFRVPLPPRAEQAEIVLATRQATKTLESASGKAAQEVMLAREYRIRLIADVVTGKLDVREAASRLQNEVEEPEPLDETDALTEGEEEPTDDLDAAPKEAAV